MKEASAVKAEIAALGDTYLFGVGKELRTLSRILNKDENIIGIISGFEGPTTVLLCLTNERLLFLDKNFWYGSHQRSIPVRRITAVESSYKLFFGKITLYEGTKSNMVTWCGKNSLRKFAKTISRVIEESMSVDKFIGEIEKLGELLNKGLITKAEFEKKKQQVMESSVLDNAY